ncbi:MAG: hypothetical protein QOC87_1728 [Actinomycetota bacterium]|nr:hypothetical protein [Actinomycetota bacterium]
MRSENRNCDSMFHSTRIIWMVWLVALCFIGCDYASSGDRTGINPEPSPSRIVAAEVVHTSDAGSAAPVPCEDAIGLDPHWRDRSIEIDHLYLGLAALPVDNAARLRRSDFFEVKAPLIYEGGGVLSMRIPKKERHRVALTYERPSTGPPTNRALSKRFGVPKGYYSVGFDACGKVRPYVFAGGIVFKGSGCVTLDFRIDQGPIEEALVPVTKGSCS